MRKVLVLMQALAACLAAYFVHIHADTGAFLFILAAIGINCVAMVYPDNGISAPKKATPPPSDFVVKFKAPKGGK
jgi:hypothetical protein